MPQSENQPAKMAGEIKLENNNMTALEVAAALATGAWRWRKAQKVKELPEALGEYALLEEIPRPEGDNECQFGLYGASSSGKFAIAKQWTGTRKDSTHYWLYNEAMVYEALASLGKESQNLLKEKYPKISSPELLKIITEENRVLLLLEKVAGENLETLPVKERMPVYEESLGYLKLLSSLIPAEKLRRLNHRNMFYVSLMFPLLWLRAFTRAASALGDLSRGALIFFKSVPLLLSQNKPALVHRDLTDLNILIDGKGRIKLLDFELTVVTHPMFEVTQIMTGAWRKQEFWPEFYKTPAMKRIFENPETFRIYRTLSVYTAVHRLATCPETEIASHWEYLRHVLNLPQIVKP